MEVVSGVRGHVVDAADGAIGRFLPLLSERLACATLGLESALVALRSLHVLDGLIAVDVVRLRHVVAKSSSWQMMRRQVMHVQPSHLLVRRLTGNLSVGAGPIAFRGPWSLYLPSHLIGVVHPLARLPNAATLMVSSLDSTHTYVVLLRSIRFIGIQHEFTFLVKLFIE